MLKELKDNSMDLNKVEELIKLVKENGLAELKYETGDEKISLKLPFSTGVAQVAAPITAVQATHPAAAPTEAAAKSSDPSLVDITCPFVGTFYRSSGPDAAAYVKVGDKVSSGKVLCIVEAMKIMNEIESEVSGEIVEICVENETYVEFGQVLFRVRP